MRLIVNCEVETQLCFLKRSAWKMYFQPQQPRLGSASLLQRWCVHLPWAVAAGFPVRKCSPVFSLHPEILAGRRKATCVCWELPGCSCEGAVGTRSPVPALLLRRCSRGELSLSFLAKPKGMAMSGGDGLEDGGIGM